MLFPGGTGSLHLTDPDELLTTGIEVTVRPAGKKIERLSLLSGGERSLAAVALLIAIFKARPSPFYILDEVEAALDDANLGRLLDDLRGPARELAAHRHHAPEAHDGDRRRALRRLDAPGRRQRRRRPARRRTPTRTARARLTPRATTRRVATVSACVSLARGILVAILVALSVGRRGAGIRRRGRLRAHLPREQRSRAVRDRRRLPPARAPRLPGRLRVADLRRAVRRLHGHLVRVHPALRRRRLRGVHRHPARVRARRLDRPPRPTDIDTDSTGLDESATIAELEALPQPPLLARTRFSSPSGLDLVEMTYASTACLDPSLTEPAFTIDVLANQRFGTHRGSTTRACSATCARSPRSLPTPAQTGVIAGGAVVLMLVVGWPATLLNSVVGSRYDGLVRWLQRRFRRRRTRDSGCARPKPSRLPGWLMWPGFALAAIIGAFVDPDFGWNPMSIRVVADAVRVVRALQPRDLGDRPGDRAAAAAGFRSGAALPLGLAVPRRPRRGRGPAAPARAGHHLRTRRGRRLRHRPAREPERDHRPGRLGLRARPGSRRLGRLQLARPDGRRLARLRPAHRRRRSSWQR